ncbi:MAG: hypothetical protein KAK00_02220 [Nanoarchaeota archaeon]|nr:hypothetical protein [Nanoarchaeota archaeon]
MRRLWLFILVFIVSISFTYAVECGSTPTDRCTVSVDTNFTPGTYFLPNGIDIASSYIDLDCNGAALIGSGSNYGIHIKGGKYYDNTIRNCNIRNYSNGIRLENYYDNSDINDHKILDNTLTDNTYGIYLDNIGNRPDMNNNIILRNTISSQEYDIFMHGSDMNSNLIADNNLYGKGIYYDYTNSNSDIFWDSTSCFNKLVFYIK